MMSTNAHSPSFANLPSYFLFFLFLFFFFFFIFFFFYCKIFPWQVGVNVKETIDFVEGLAPEDPLIKGVPEDKNPFKEKGGCIIT